MPNADDGLPPSGPVIQRAFNALITSFEKQCVRYVIIGGVAAIPRPPRKVPPALPSGALGVSLSIRICRHGRLASLQEREHSPNSNE